MFLKLWEAQPGQVIDVVIDFKHFQLKIKYVDENNKERQIFFEQIAIRGVCVRSLLLFNSGVWHGYDSDGEGSSTRYVHHVFLTHYNGKKEDLLHVIKEYKPEMDEILSKYKTQVDLFEEEKYRKDSQEQLEIKEMKKEIQELKETIEKAKQRIRELTPDLRHLYSARRFRLNRLRNSLLYDVIQEFDAKFKERNTDSDSDSDSKSGDRWIIDDFIINCLGPGAGDVIQGANKIANRDAARDYVINCLGPADGDILYKNKGKVFEDDESNDDEEEEEA